jgi:CubicO group peptidase (beta-lactamase class C family)
MPQPALTDREGDNAPCATLFAADTRGTIRGGWMTDHGRMAVCPTRLIAVVAVFACAITFTAARPPLASAASVNSRVSALIRDAIAHHDIRAVIFQATKNGRTIMTKAYGDSQPGVPATTNMHFRNGAVAISYMSTLLLRPVDQGKVKLDDKISKWMPNLRDSNQVTLGELASMTAGYHDLELDPRLYKKLYANPFGTITTHFQMKLLLDSRSNSPRARTSATHTATT